MKFSTIASAFTLIASATAVSVSFDRGYDNPSSSMSTVTCSDGPNGLAKKFPTQGDLPIFPYIGGVPAITGWNSPACGSCWELTYNGRSINVLGIDVAQGYNIAFAAMDDLTDGNAEFLGRIEASAREVDRSVCGL